MGPPLGHVRDPNKQHRFVEAELSALLQAAGGTMPVIKKDARGVFIMETSPAHGAAPAKPVAAGTAPPTPAAKAAPAATAAAAVQKAAAPKLGAEPNRGLNRRTTYAGVVDSGPVAGETFEQKVARLRAVAAAAKQRAEEGGDAAAPVAAPDSPVVASVLETAMTPAPADAATESTSAAEFGSTLAASAVNKPTGQADRSLMIRSTYCGVVDTGPVPGETFEQKVARLQAVATAAKQRADGG
jgi:hypothetical protein